MHHDTSANRVHRCSVGVVELDALVRLEVAAHRRAETIGLVDVGLIGERDGAAEPGVAGSLNQSSDVRGCVKTNMGVSSGRPFRYVRRRVALPRASTVGRLSHAANVTYGNQVALCHLNPLYVLILNHP